MDDIRPASSTLLIVAMAGSAMSAGAMEYMLDAEQASSSSSSIGYVRTYAYVQRYTLPTFLSC
jgi:hypothetical protein